MDSRPKWSLFHQVDAQTGYVRSRIVTKTNHSSCGLRRSIPIENTPKDLWPPPHRIDEVIVPVHLPDTRDVREDLRLYYDEIGRPDNHVGSVRAQLERVSLAENTAVLFLSGNGRPFPREKKTISDGGIRTP